MTTEYQNCARKGPRDVFAFEPIRTPVVNALASTGMSANLIIKLLGIDNQDVAILIHAEVGEKRDEPDVRAALLEWLTRSEYREKNLRKAYGAACEMSLTSFVSPDPRWDEKVDTTYVPHRVNHEVLQALSLWLEIDEFERRSDQQIGFLEDMLRVACEDPEADLHLSRLLQCAFQSKLNIPFDLVHDLVHETVKAACENGIPSTAKPGKTLSDHLTRVQYDIARRRVRPFFGPIWPSGTGDRVRTLLRSVEWTEDPGAEIRLICDSAALNRAAEAAHVAFRAEKTDAESANRLRQALKQAQEAAMAVYHALPMDRSRRKKAQEGIASWLATKHPELIELVRPCGNPLNAKW